jgi:DUF4097 and DUF4098 domain-containing protein YvlB
MTDRVRVDYTVSVPAAVEVDARSVSGGIKVTGVRGVTRVESVSGDLTTSATPNLESAKSVSGNLDVADLAGDRSVSAASLSGSVRARNIRARALSLSTVSGDATVTDAECERVDAKTITGSIEYTGPLSRNGRYEFNSHSGTLRLTVPDSTGFTLSVSTFSGMIRSDLPMTLSGDGSRRGGRGRFGGLNGRSIQGTFRDGSASLSLRTFSGDIVISKR